MEQNVLNTDLTGKVAVVTGASGTLCSIFAKALARAGAKVALLGRFGDSEMDLVGALLFLLNNDAAGFITGICLPIDGGFSAYSGV